MRFDFTTIPDRRGKDSIAVDGTGTPNGFIPGSPKDGFSLIPMWVADMNFLGLPAITDAIGERIKHNSFGYFSARDEYYDSIIRWQKVRNGSEVSRESIGYENGVLGCYASTIRAYTGEGDNILLLDSGYIGFIGTVKSLKRTPVYSTLYRDEKGVWRMNYEDIENKIKEYNIKVATFCTPYNPTGRVWHRDEILRFMEICRKYDVIVFSDEIWSDIILYDNKFIPTRDVSEDAKMRTVTACAPTKTFNLAGLVGSYHIIANEEIRNKVNAAAGSTHYNNMNVLSQYSLIGAYGKDGEEWVDELCKVLSDNVTYAYDHIVNRYKGISLAKPEGTYMLYLDCTEYLEKHGLTIDELLAKGWDVGVAWQNGVPFGTPNTIRINLALPFSQVKEAFERLDKYVFEG